MLGKEGLYWLQLHTANCWGYNKVGLNARVDFVTERLEWIKKIAEDPITNNDWIDAEDPFCFLAAVIEVTAAYDWVSRGQPIEEFPSNLPVYIDATNSAIQHLSALTLDREIGKLVNLTREEELQDVYMFIAEKIWERLEGVEENIPNEIKNQLDIILETVFKLQEDYDLAPRGSQRKTDAFQALQTWRNNNRRLRESLFSVYWCRVKEKSLRRKIAKRPVMTIGYGSSKYGMGRQVYDDSRGLSDYLSKQEMLWSAMLGDLIYHTCYEELKGPAKMLKLFVHLAEKASEKDQPLSWNTPITNFPVIQNYKKAISVRTFLQYGEDRINVRLASWEETTLDASSQKQAAAPNVVHSLDATHLAMVVDASPFKITVIHDSFGTHAGNMGELFYLVREKFVELYESDPLSYILYQMEADPSEIKRGDLDLREVLVSDFAFS